MHLINPDMMLSNPFASLILGNVQQGLTSPQGCRDGPSCPTWLHPVHARNTIPTNLTSPTSLFAGQVRLWIVAMRVHIKFRKLTLKIRLHPFEGLDAVQFCNSANHASPKIAWATCIAAKPSPRYDGGEPVGATYWPISQGAGGRRGRSVEPPPAGAPAPHWPHPSARARPGQPAPCRARPPRVCR